MTNVKVKVRATIEYEIEVDELYAHKEHIEFYRNHGTYCWDNFVDELDEVREKQEEKGSCLCYPIRPKFEVLEK